MLSKYQINILLRGVQFTSTPKRNIIQLKSDIHNYTQELHLTEFFHNALKIIIYKIFLTPNPILHNLETGMGI